MMKVEGQLLDEVRTSLLNELRQNLNEGRFFSDCLEVLQAQPKLALDTEIAQLVKQVLMTRALGFRVSASVVLTEIDDPDGILHLTYNSLSTHPILGLNQLQVSGWCDLVARYANKLTDECIDWLIKDTQGDDGPLFHGVTLAQLPDEKIIPRVMPLLGAGGWASRNAAYVLAYKGDDAGFEVLEEWIRDRTHPLLPAFEALSHLGTRQALTHLEEYANPQHDIYTNEKLGDRYRHYMLSFVRMSVEMLSSNDPMRVTRIMEKYYLKTFHEIEIFNRLDPYQTQQYQLKEPLDFFVNLHREFPEMNNLEARTLMARFSTAQDREYCGHKQEASIRQLFDRHPLDFYDLDDGVTCRFFLTPFILRRSGFKTKYQNNSYQCLPRLRFVYDRDDYIHAATNWLTNPWRWQDTW